MSEIPTVPPPSPPLRVTLAALTDVGAVREHNEDALLVADVVCGGRDFEVTDHVHLAPPCVLVLGVFDGMGGAAAGEVASAIARDTVYECLTAASPATIGDLADRLSTALDRASARIFADAITHAERRGMGTTATLAGVTGTDVFLAQVGDSRAYLLRRGELAQVTQDQSLVARMVASGRMSASEARTSPVRNVVLQALGVTHHVQVDRSAVAVQGGDGLLLCSDGLSGELDDEEIRDVLVSTPVPREACRRLVARAKEAGGSDNITCVVVRFDHASERQQRGAGVVVQTLSAIASLARSLRRDR